MKSTLETKSCTEKPLRQEELLAFFTKLAITRCGLDVTCPSCSFSYSVDDDGKYTSSGKCENPNNCPLVD